MANLKEIVCTPENPFGVEREMSDADQVLWDAQQKEFTDNTDSRKLESIKRLRLQKLEETDWWVFRGDITDEQKLYRKNLRDIPENYSADKYDELIARDDDGKLTHSIWSKP